MAFRRLSANAAPDFRSLSRFRRRHGAGARKLFVQVLVMYSAAGLLKLGRVALDETTLRATASRHQAMSHDRPGPRIAQVEAEVEAEVAAILAEAETTDLAERPASLGCAQPRPLLRPTPRGKRRLRTTQGHRRTSLWTDECPTLRRLPSSRTPRGGSERVDPARGLPQPTQSRRFKDHRGIRTA